MKIITAKPLVPHYCRTEIAKDPRSKELGVGSLVECDCGKKYELKSDQREGRFWEEVLYRGYGY